MPLRDRYDGFSGANQYGPYGTGGLVVGKHLKELYVKGASKKDVARLTGVLSHPHFIAILEKHPLNVLTIRKGGGVFEGAGENHAAYHTKGSIVVNSKAAENPVAKLSQGKGTIGGPKGGSGIGTEHEQQPWSIARMGKSASEDTERTLVHEFGHHVHASYKGDEVDEVVSKAFAHPSKNPVTSYAEKNKEEYFAESFTAYHYHPEELKRHDPIGYKMVEDVIALRTK